MKDLERHAILIAGMHRSGTSALTKVINLLGYGLPENLLAPSPNDNPLGFWESEEVMTLNNDILASLGSNWNDWSPLGQQLLLDESFLKSQAARASGLLEQEYGDASHIVLKDPRNCRLAPIWVAAFTNLNYSVSFVIPIRNPLEVASSLEKRNQVHADYTLLSWLRHVLDAELYSREFPRTFTLYQNLVDDWRSTAFRIAQDLEISWPRHPDEAAAEIDAFISPKERHNIAPTGTLTENRAASAWVAEAFSIIKSWAENRPTAEGGRDLDRIRREFDKAAPAFYRIVADSDSTIKGMRHENTSISDQLAKLRSEVIATRAQYNQEAGRKQEVRKNLDASQKRNMDLQNRVDALGFDKKILQKKIADHKRTLRDLNNQVKDRENANHELRQSVDVLAKSNEILRQDMRVTLDRYDELTVQNREANLRLERSRSSIAKANADLLCATKDSQRKSRELEKITDSLFEKNYKEKVLLSDKIALENKLSQRSIESSHLHAEISTKQKALRRSEKQLSIALDKLANSQRYAAATFKTQVETAGKTMLPEPFPTIRRMIEIRASGLFDASWYISHYQDVACDMKARSNPMWHFARYGWREGRAPNADIAAVLGSRTKTPKTEAPKPPTPKQSQSTKDGIRKKLNFGERDRIKKIIESEFDEKYYLLKYTDIANAKKITALEHYVSHGGKEGRNPNSFFDGKFYLDHNPDVKESGQHPFYHYLTVGRKEGRPASPMAAGAPSFDKMCKLLGRPPKEVEDDLNARQKDIQERLRHGVLSDMISKASELEPLIAHCEREIISVKIPPFHSPPVVNEVVATHQLHEEAGFRRAKAVVMIPHCRMSGATRIGGYLSKALAKIYGEDEIVIIRTDLDIMQFPEWFPENVRHVNFAKAATNLDAAQRQRLLFEFLRSLNPIGIYNVNSALFWNILQPFGKALSASTNIYCYFFCNDKNIYGHWEGYPITQFYRNFDILSGVITDSHFLADELKSRFLVPPQLSDKVAVLETPVTVSPDHISTPPRNSRRQVFWSGRFDRQKRVDIAFEVAKNMPDVDFSFWGEAVIDDISKLEKPSNVTLQGSYQKFEDLPLAKCDAWLYTAEWDGVPNMLIEVAVSGVPLVGSLAGGTGEILQEGLSCRIDDIEDVAAYVKGLREIFGNPEAARSKAAELREKILMRRTKAAYEQQVRKLIDATTAARHET